MNLITRQLVGCAAGISVAMIGGGCAHVAVEGGDKPIHIVLDVNLRVDHELDQFFAFEQHAPGTQPATTPTASAAGEH